MDREEIEAKLAQASETEDWALARTCRSMLIDLETDPGARVDELVELASLEREQLGDLVAAQETLRRAVEIDPTHAKALWELQALYGRTACWAEYVAVGERRLELAATPADSADLLRDLARVYRDQLGDSTLADECDRRADELSG